MRASSLFTGATGIKAHDRAMSSVADNIANVSTHGFKGTRAMFNTLISRELVQMGRTSDVAGYRDSSQVGLGVVCKPMNVMTAAALDQTGLNTDLGIEGQGFFIVKASATYTSPFGSIHSDQLGSRADSPNYYTRAGQFHVDRNGYIVNQQNYVLQGYLTDDQGQITMGPLEDLRLPSEASQPKATSQVELAINLNAADNVVHADTIAIDPQDATSYNYSSPATIYDANGDPHNLMMFYQRVEPMSSRSWKVEVFEKDGDNFTALDDGHFRLNFDDTGKLSLINDPSSDRFLSDTGLSNNQLLSTVMGQSLSYSGANGTEQVLSQASLVFNAGTTAGESVSIGGRSYTLGSHGTAIDAAAELVSLINRDAVNAGCFAVNNGSGVVSLQPLNSNPLDISASTLSIAINAGMTTTQAAQAINNGQASGGTLVLNNLAAAGQSINIGAHSYTVPSAASLAEMAVSLADIITQGGQYSATAQGEGVYISALTPGKDGDVSFGSSDTLGNIALSGSALAGGLDSSDISKIQAKVVTDAQGGQSLSLARIGAGEDALITGLTSTFTTSAGDPLTFTQTEFAGNRLNITDGKLPVDYTLADGTSQPLTFDFLPQDESFVTSQQAENYDLHVLKQDGYPLGEIDDLAIDKDGNVIISFTNQQVYRVGTIALATFNDPWDLDRYGDNLWLGTPASGEAKIGIPNDDQYALGSIQSGALEKSNVDMAQEMVNMINYQRAYQMNSKSITTTDEMLKEAINIKR